MEAVRTEGGYFQAEGWAVPMDGHVELTVTITDGGVSRSEALDTLSADPADYRLAVEGQLGDQLECRDRPVRQPDLAH